MVKLRKLSQLKNMDCFAKLLGEVNSIQSNYQWAEKTPYQENDIENIYLIISSENTLVGFVECEYQDTEIWLSKPIKLFLHEIHIAPDMQGKGIGREVLSRLLRKAIQLEMVVANENEKMLSLVGKFNAEHKYITANTRTVLINP